MSVLTFKSDEFKTFPAVLRDYANYMVAIKGISEKTVCEYLLDLRTLFRFIIMSERGERLDKKEFEEISISSVTLEDIKRVTPERIIEFLIYAGYDRENSTTTRMRKLSSIKSLFKYLHGKKRLIDTDPTADIDAPKKAKTLPKYLSVEEAVRLLETVKGDGESKTRIRDFAIITLFLNTGMRLSELCGLNLDSLDSELNYVKVLGKGNKERIIYLKKAANDALRAYLKERLDPRFVITSDKALFLSARQQRISAKTVQWVIYKYLDLAGLGAKGLSVHKLRHTAATLMYQSGKVDIRVLKDVLGHEQLNTTQIYAHVVSRNLEDAVDSNPLADVKIGNKIIRQKGEEK